MTILQSTLAKGQKQAPQAFGTGINVSYLADFTIPAGMTVATTDIIELGVLPAGHRVIDARVIPTGDFGASVTADVGIMSGDVGSTGTRTSGAEIFDDVALTAMVGLAKADSILLADADQHRSIGVKFSASITGAGQVIRLQLTYAQ